RVHARTPQLTGTGFPTPARIGGSQGDGLSGTGNRQASQTLGESSSKYRGAQGLDPAFIKKLEKQFGFDKPAYERFFIMLKNYLVFDFGRSFFRDIDVVDLIKEKLPVSITLGLWTTLLTYLISIPLGISKAVRDGTRFDTVSSTIIIVGYAVPGFLLAIFLIVLFAGGSFWNIFPLRGLHSDDWQLLPWYGKITDYFWHITLPIVCMMV